MKEGGFCEKIDVNPNKTCAIIITLVLIYMVTGSVTHLFDREIAIHQTFLPGCRPSELTDTMGHCFLVVSQTILSLQETLFADIARKTIGV